MNFFRRLFHRPSARIVTAFERAQAAEAERAVVLAPLKRAMARKDKRGEGERSPPAIRATNAALRAGLGR